MSTQGVLIPPSDEGGAERLSEAEGEITQHYSHTPSVDSSRIICINTHCIESGIFFLVIQLHYLSPAGLNSFSLQKPDSAAPSSEGA